MVAGVTRSHAEQVRRAMASSPEMVAGGARSRASRHSSGGAAALCVALGAAKPIAQGGGAFAVACYGSRGGSVAVVGDVEEGGSHGICEIGWRRWLQQQ